MKIRFLRLVAQNIWSYKTLSLNLPDKGLTIIQGENRDAGGSNGSGKCLCDQPVTMADGTAKMISQVHPGEELLCLDDKLRINKTRVLATSSEKKDCYRVVLHDGRYIEASANHPLLTMRGWVKLEELSVGDSVATPRRLPPIAKEAQISTELAELVGLLLGDGCLCKRTPEISLGAKKAKIAEALPDLIKELPDLKINKSDRSHNNCSCYRFVLKSHKQNPINPLTSLLEDLGVMGLGACDKYIPKVIMEGPTPVIVAVLKGLFGTDGSLSICKGDKVDLSFTSASEKMVRQVQQLLLHLNIISRVRSRTVKNQSHKLFKRWTLEVVDVHAKLQFLTTVGTYDKEKTEKFILILNDKLKVKRSPFMDLIPHEVWGLIRKERGEIPWSKITPPGLVRAEDIYTKKRIGTSRRVVKWVGEKLNSAPILNLAESDIYWNKIVSIEPIGIKSTYDLRTVPIGDQGPNFICNSVFVHNSAIPLIFYYCLTGTTPDGLRTDHLLSDFYPRDLYVGAEFMVGDTKYSVIRSREHSEYGNMLKLLKDGTEISRKNMSDTQDEIYKILGLSRENLLMLTLFSMDTINFARCSPSERRTMFTSLFPLINEYREVRAPLFKQRKEDAERILAELKRESYAQQRSAEAFESLIVEKQEALRVKEEELSYKNEYINDDREKEIVKKINDIIADIKQRYPQKVVDNMYNLEPFIKKLVVKIKALESEIGLYTIEHRSHASELARADETIRIANKAITSINEAVARGECDHCGTQFEAIPPRYKEKLEEYEGELQEAIDRRTKVVEAYKKVEKDTEALKSEILALEVKHGKLLAIHEEVQEIRRLREEQNAIVAAIQPYDRAVHLKEIETIREDIERLEDQLSRINNTIRELELQAESAEINVKHYTYLHKISSIDIPTYLLNRYTSLLEGAATDILGKLFPGMRLVLSDTTTTKSGNEKVELTLGVETQNGLVKDYKTLSRGERQAVDISLLFGIQRLVIDETGMEINIIFLDEILDIAADEVRTQNIIDFLMEVSREYESMFLISHKSTLNEYANSLLTVVKEGGVSHLTYSGQYSN